MTSLPTEISNFFLAMQAGAAGGRSMEGLFAAKAIYEEPFSGSVQRHEGADAILTTMRQGWSYNPPDIHIAIEGARTHNEDVLVDWVCYSSSLPGGVGRGTNRFTLEGRKIVKLITSLR